MNILNGPSIKSDIKIVPQAALSIAQLILNNCHVRRRKDSASSHHTLTKETPLPIYVGLESPAKTRKRQLADTLFDLGISIFYDRVLSISTDLGSTVCQQYRSENIVCPFKIRRDLFSVAAVDTQLNSLCLYKRQHVCQTKKIVVLLYDLQMVICVLTSVVSICSPAKTGLSKPTRQQNGHYYNMLKGLPNKLTIFEDSHLFVLLRIFLLVTGDGLRCCK